jgi:hypothetical protein
MRIQGLQSARVGPAEAGLLVRWAARLGIALLLAGALAGARERRGPVAAAAEHISPPGRPYPDGPLSAEDFQATPADRSPLTAYTMTDLRWDYRYQYQRTGRTVVAFLKDVTINAVVVASQSWNRRPGDKRLLDHEQGHFDLAWIVALQARLHFAEEYQVRRLTATGATSEIALENLRRKVDGEMRAAQERLIADHAEYDRVTRHGLDRAAQAEQRKSQGAAIQKLTADLKKLEVKRSP